MSVHPKFKIRKGDSHRNRKYLDWVKQRSCLVCKKYGVDPHHSWNANSNDYVAVNLCREHHTEYHHLQEEKFGEKYGINFLWEINELLMDYIIENDL